MQSIAYYDGTIGAPEDLKVPFNDRSHFFGDGVYDAAMGANGRIFLLEDHLDRFYSSAAYMRINVPLDRAKLGALLIDLLAHVKDASPSQFVYWQVTRGFSGERQHVFDTDASGKLWVLINQEALADPKEPMHLISIADRRFEYGNAKTLNLLPAVLYAQQAAEAGADEAILHRNGIVTECAHSNIQILRDGVLFAHPNDEHILRGIAKTHLVQAAWRAAVPVIERAFTLDDVRAADEVIVTSSSDLCRFACELDGESIGGRDPHTLRQLQDLVYAEYSEYCGL